MLALVGSACNRIEPCLSLLQANLIPKTYRVFLFSSNGPTQKSSKYGSGPIQQDKKCTGPTQRSSDVRVVNNQFLLVAVVGGFFEGRKL